jgi:hypothetical protein
MPTWTYGQKTGSLRGSAVGVIAHGYAGAGVGKNNPDMDAVPNIGPLPRGKYTIGPPYDSSHSPYTLRLTPDPKNDMHGRAGFLIHGDSIHNPGTASQGCIILPRSIRQEIWESGDHDLQVVHTDV